MEKLTAIGELRMKIVGKAQAKELVIWLEKYVFYIDSRGYIALKPDATHNWGTLLEEVKLNDG